MVKYLLATPESEKNHRIQRAINTFTTWAQTRSDWKDDQDVLEPSINPWEPAHDQVLAAIPRRIAPNGIFKVPKRNHRAWWIDHQHAYRQLYCRAQLRDPDDIDFNTVKKFVCITSKYGSGRAFRMLVKAGRYGATMK